MLGIIILTAVIGAALVVGCLIGAYLQQRGRPRRLPGPTIVRHTMYLLPEKRER